MNLYLLGTILNISAIYMTAGAGSFLSIKGGNFNLGGEGQIYAGGFTAAVVLVALKDCPPVIALSAGFICAGLISAFLAFIPAVLKIYRNVDVLLSSFLISAGCIPLIDSFVAGKFRGATNNLLATEFIPVSFRFSSILKPSSLNITFFAALFICGLLYFLMTRTLFGHRLSVFGISSDFGIYSGYSEKKLVLVSVTVSGFLHGLAGFFCIAGTYFTCHSGFYSGMGWNAFSVSLIAQKNPLYLIPSAVVISALTTCASQFSLMHNFGFDMGTLLQGVVLFAIVLGVRNRDK